MKASFILILLSLIIYGCGSSVNIPSAQKAPVPMSQQEENELKRGMLFHESGNYTDAIKIYTEMLTSNPNNIDAIHEIAFSYYMARNYNKSLEYALKGLEYNSKYQSMFYGMAGNSLDLLDRPKDAVLVYKEGIKLFPGDFMNHYNLGLVYYYRLKELDKAEESFTNTIRLNPNHASSHLALAEIFMKQGKQVQTLLILCRFLVLEPKTERAKLALQYLEAALNHGVDKKDDKNVNINIFSAMDKQTPYSGLELMLKLQRAMAVSEKNKDKSQFQIKMENMSTFFSMLKNYKDNKTEDEDFISQYLFPYFTEISSKKNSEVFIYYIHQASNLEEVKTWLNTNKQKIEQLTNWNNNYIWNLN